MDYFSNNEETIMILIVAGIFLGLLVGSISVLKWTYDKVTKK